MDWDIEWIYSAPRSVEYAFELIDGCPMEPLIQRFEAEHNVAEGEDIGGLIVYSNNCVYDYENFCGWVR